MNKRLLKELLPPFLVRYFTGFFYGWHGNYKSWDMAIKNCTGYNSSLIFDKVRSSALMVKAGEVKFERDSVVFDKSEYNFAVLSSLLWISGLNNNKLRVLDFGGGLGSLFYQNRFFLENLKELKWSIVEQPGFVDIGKKEFSDHMLVFYNSIDECLVSSEIDVILLSSVLPYVEDPYGLLSLILEKKFPFILFNKMPFISTADRLTIQKVKPDIYEATYPSWFFNLEKFRTFMGEHYDLIFDFDNEDKANIKSEFKGFLYKIKNGAFHESAQ